MYTHNQKIGSQIILKSLIASKQKGLHSHGMWFLPLLRHFNPAEPVVEKSVIL
jgi:hypothetical protein